MLRMLVDKVESAQEQMRNVSRELETLRKSQAHGGSCKAVPFVYFKFLIAIYIVNFLSHSSKKPRAVSFYANASTSFLWSQEEGLTLVCLRSHIHSHSWPEDPQWCEVPCENSSKMLSQKPEVSKCQWYLNESLHYKKKSQKSLVKKHIFILTNCFQTFISHNSICDIDSVLLSVFMKKLCKSKGFIVSPRILSAFDLLVDYHAVYIQFTAFLVM